MKRMDEWGERKRMSVEKIREKNGMCKMNEGTNKSFLASQKETCIEKSKTLDGMLEHVNSLKRQSDSMSEISATLDLFHFFRYH